MSGLTPAARAAWLAKERARTPIAPMPGVGAPEDESPAVCPRCGGDGAWTHAGYRSTLFHREGGAWVCWRCRARTAP